MMSEAMKPLSSAELGFMQVSIGPNSYFNFNVMRYKYGVMVNSELKVCHVSRQSALCRWGRCALTTKVRTAC